MSYDQVVGASGRDDASSGVAMTMWTIWGSSWGSSKAMASVVASWGGGIWTSTVVVFSVEAKGSYDARRSVWGGGKSPRCCWIWRSIVVCWFWWARISAIYWKRATCVVVSIWKVCIRLRNSEAKMVMEGSDVVGATGETVWVIGRATKVASGLGHWWC